VRSNIVASQLDHDRFGGVVPEVAARAHLTQIGPVIALALRDAGVTLDDIGRVAVTAGPGLTGALVIGMAAAKGIALSRGLPLHAVDHLHGHICANALGPAAVEPPFVCLIASGGHSFVAAVAGYEREQITVLGRTLDDAAGEAIDKGARMLGLPFPGGPALQELAAGGDPAAFAFPVAAGVAGLDFSFAGLKTALLYTIRDLGKEQAAARRADLAASYQEAVIAQLARRAERALAETGMRRLALGGGVAANGPLRERLSQLAAELHAPAREYCTDNAAMIAAAAPFTPAAVDAAGLDVYPTGTVSL